MASVYNDNNQVNAPKALDNKRGKFASGAWRPYNDVAEAIATVLSAYRHKGLTVEVLKDGVLTEYWWRDNITDGGLIEKSATVTVDAVPTDGSSNAVSSNGTFDALATKQATLVSGTNIKTINGTSVLGSGDITISGGTLDTVPTNGSTNGVESNGVFDADAAIISSLTSHTSNTSNPHSVTKAQVGLSNVDNTSDATKDAAVATLTNKTISGADNNLSNIPQSAVSSLTTDLGNKVGNDTDSYTGTAKVQQIITLSQAEYDAIGTKDVNTFYMVI